MNCLLFLGVPGVLASWRLGVHSSSMKTCRKPRPWPVSSGRRGGSMPKGSRKAAIAAELARRDAATGVPPDRFVYELQMHYPDDGGPRPFVTREFAEWAAARARARADAPPYGW